MRVLVTGSSGRIGSAIASRLRREHAVTGLDLLAGGETTVLGSITDTPLVRSLCSRVDAVVHCAALHAPHVGLSPDAAFRAVNVDATEALLEASLTSHVRRFVFTSTTSIYGRALVPVDRAVWVTESLAPEPRDIYDETKLEAEWLCARAADAGLPCLSLRMSRCYPEPPHLMAIYRLYRGIDARDVADAHARALSAPVAGYDVCNVSAHTPFSAADCPGLLGDAAAVVRRCCPWIEAEFAARGWTLPTSIDRVYVSDRARTLLGFESRYDVAALLAGR